MRTASFLFLSITLHAAALAYPAFFIASEKATPIVVTVVEPDGGGGGSGENSPAERVAGVPGKNAPQAKRLPAAAQPTQPTERKTVPESVAISAPAESIALPVIEKQSSGAIPIPTRESAAIVAFEGAASPNGAASGGSSGAASLNGGGGTRSGSGTGSGSGNGSGSGSGTGAGSGSGSGDGNGDPRFLQASYAVCPRADYPEAAKREGHEGTIMVEVLVDEEGRPKSSRVLQSSGFPLLDRAAVDNIQRRCRFHPAKRGERRVETSIKIPIVFRLADSKAR